jgi:hypothetical protein
VTDFTPRLVEFAKCRFNRINCYLALLRVPGLVLVFVDLPDDARFGKGPDANVEAQGDQGVEFPLGLTLLDAVVHRLLEGLDSFVKHAVGRLREHFRLVAYHVLRSRCRLVFLWLSELVECLAELL